MLVELGRSEDDGTRCEAARALANLVRCSNDKQGAWGQARVMLLCSGGA